MKWYNKLFKAFKQKSIVTGGLEVVQRIFGGAGQWTKTKQMSQYSKSLYVFACVRKIAEKTASQDIRLFQIINSKGDKKEITSHPALDLLYRVNPFQTKSEFLEMTMINLKLAGDAFWWKIRNERGQVGELWNLRPDLITIVTDPEKFIVGYEFAKSDGTKVKFQTEDIIHFKYPNPLDQYYGMSPIMASQVRIDTEAYASQYQRDFFLNNARPDAILKFKDNVDITDEQKREIRKGWDRRYKGVGKNSKIAILEGEVDYQQLSISQREMDYIESMKFTRDDILVAYSVPKAIVAITDDVNRANAETSMHIFLSEVIAPELKRLEEKINEQLIYPEFGDNLFIKFPDPTPENREMTLKEYDTGIKAGYLLINEVREKENLPPIAGGWDLYLPFSVASVGTLKVVSKKEVNRTFRGKGILKMKIELKEKMTKEIYSQLNNKQRAKKKNNATIKIEKADDDEPKETIPKSLIGADELKMKYADVVNKQIDGRSLKLEKDMNRRAKEQENGFIKLLSEIEIPKKSEAKKNKFEKIKDKAVDFGDFKQILGVAMVRKFDEFFDGEDKVMAEFILPFVENSVKDAGLDALLLINQEGQFEMTEAVQKRIQKRADEFGPQINGTTRTKLAKGLAEGITEGEGIVDLRLRVEGVYEEYPTYRSEMIARTETTASNNEGFIEGFRQSGVATHKEWVAVMDERTRPEHVALNGDIIKLDESFANGLQYPQEPNCRCVIAPAFEE